MSDNAAAVWISAIMMASVAIILVAVLWSARGDK